VPINPNENFVFFRSAVCRLSLDEFLNQEEMMLEEIEREK
jgi:hypothetical protein